MSRRTWIIIFVVLFLLSLDFWSWGGGPSRGPLGIPRWIYYFLLLQLALAAAIHFFGRDHWHDEDPPS